MCDCVCLLSLPVAATLSALANPEPLQNFAQLRRESSYFLALALHPAFGGIDRRRLLIVMLVPVCVMGVYAVIQHYTGIDWLRIDLRGTGAVNVVRAYGRGENHVYYAEGCP